VTIQPDRLVSVSILLFLILLPSSLCMAERRDPKSGKIRLLNMGADAVPGTASPLVVLFTDPLISQQTVPLYSTIFQAGETERFMRIYMPRSEAKMREDFDLIMISDATVDNFPAKYFPWMISAVEEGGLGFFTTGGSAMYGGRGQYSSWESASIVRMFAVAFKTNDVYEVGSSGHAPVKIVPEAKDNEFVTSLPWKTAPPINYLIHIVTTKQGATTLLKMNVPQEYPILSYWDYGRGRATNLIFDWYPWRIEPFQQWIYYIDFATNLIYFSAGLRVPQDLELVHSIRFQLAKFMEDRTVLISLLNFVEKFGANTNSVERKLSSLDGDYARAQELYREQDWEGALQTLKDLHSSVSRLEEDAIRLKNRALFWIYVIEWFTVMGTLFVTGFILWTLMVKRRLYGEVKVTRLRFADDQGR